MSRWRIALAHMFVWTCMGCGPTPVAHTGADQPQPNILILHIDGLRTDRIGLDTDGKTIAPNLMSLASEGVRFSQVQTHSSSSSISFVSLLAGTTPLGALQASDAGNLETIDSAQWLPAVLGQRGYAIGFGGGATPTRKAAIQNWFGGRGFDDLEDIEAYTQRVEQGLIQPFFHVLADRSVQVPTDTDPAFADVDPNDPRDTQTILRQWLTHHYEQSLRDTDDKIGALLTALRKSGLTKNTIIVLSAGHGEELADHDVGIGHKARPLYDTVTVVPVIIRSPTMPGRGDIIETPVHLSDLAPTLLDLAHTPIPQTMTGMSLQTALQAPEQRLAERESYMTLFEHAAAVRSGMYKLIYQPIGCEPHERATVPHLTGTVCELVFDLSRDPTEQDNIAKDNPALTANLRERLLAYLQIRDATNPAQANQTFHTNIQQHGYWTSDNPGQAPATETTQAPPTPRPPPPVRTERVDARLITVTKRAFPDLQSNPPAQDTDPSASCRIMFEVDTTGIPTDVQAITCETDISEVMMQAAMQWRFEPWVVDASPRPFKVVKTIPLQARGP